MIRLISPNRRRIYPNAQTGTFISTAGSIVKNQREGLDPGDADVLTLNALTVLGWTEYNGPAKTDSHGYIIPGTDPAVRP